MKLLFFITAVLFLIGCSHQPQTEVATVDSEELNETIEEKDSVVFEEEIDTIVIDKSTDWYKLGLKNNVSSITIHEYSLDEDGEEMGMGGSYEEIEFNELGQITAIYKDGCCGAESEYIEYVYNDEGVLTHRIRRLDLDRDEKYEVFEEKEKYFYDSSGELVKIKYAGRDKVLIKEKSFKYTADGTVKSDRMDFSIDSSYSITDYFYTKGMITKTISGSSPDMKYTVIQYFNGFGLQDSERMEFSSGMAQNTKYEYEVDVRENWIERISLYRYDGEEEWRYSTKTTRSIKYY